LFFAFWNFIRNEKVSLTIKLAAFQSSGRAEPYHPLSHGIDRMTSTGTSREIFLERIRRALDHGPGAGRRGGRPSTCGNSARAALIRGEVLQRTRQDRLALLDLLIERARITGMAVIPCPGIDAATREVVALVRQESRARDESVEVVAWRHPLIDRLVLERELSALARPIRLYRAGRDRRRFSESTRLQSRQKVAVARFGITSADWCVADTATLVSRTQAGRDRWMAVLPPVNIVLLPLDVLIADLKELYALLLCEPSLTNYMSLISGPSTTRDIESIAVTGAHGPREVHILVVD
jgi:L-lactate dehydrogenase complex protein LldG